MCVGWGEWILEGQVGALSLVGAIHSFIHSFNRPTPQPVLSSVSFGDPAMSKTNILPPLEQRERMM